MYKHALDTNRFIDKYPSRSAVRRKIENIIVVSLDYFLSSTYTGDVTSLLLEGSQLLVINQFHENITEKTLCSIADKHIIILISILLDCCMHVNFLKKNPTKLYNSLVTPMYSTNNLATFLMDIFECIIIAIISTHS